MDSPIDIPGYEFLQVIGTGGMATVWKARQVKLERIVAIKVLNSSVTEDPETHQRFLYEARAAATMIHPNIVHVIDAGERDGRGYYVMEYVPGDSIGDQLSKRGAFPEAAALEIAVEVAEALHYGWADHKTIHCDIKPDNILQHRNGRIKLADLGLAQVFGLDAVPIDEGMTMGTPNYFAPEQALVEDKLDCRTDIYALGATLYHMVTGQLPFKGLAPEAVAEQQVHGNLADPFKLDPQLSVGICYLLEKLMAKEAKHRHRDWEEVIEDLRQVQAGGMIADPLPKANLSTVLRSSARPPAYLIEATQPIVALDSELSELVKRSESPPLHTEIQSQLDRLRLRSQIRTTWTYAVLLSVIAAALYASTVLNISP